MEIIRTAIIPSTAYASLVSPALRMTLHAGIDFKLPLTPLKRGTRSGSALPLWHSHPAGRQNQLWTQMYIHHSRI
eukprot:1140296-Pelagomonas_calceolata.AAC.1